MTDDDTPSISFTSPPDFLKLDRSTMAQLVVEAEHCPRVLSRVLEAVRERDMLPFTITTRRDARVQTIELEVGAPPPKPALAILQDLRRLPNVRAARFLHPAEANRQAIPARV